MFNDCSSLTNVNIPQNVISIGNYAFNNCSSLSKVSIPESVISIGEWAFGECINLTSISIPENVTSIGDYAFNGCISLKNAGPICGGYDYEFGWEKSIPNNAFNGCRGMLSINIPESMTSVGDAAFNGCDSLTSVRIPKNVVSIGNFAFNGCDSLNDIKILNPRCSIYDSSYAISRDTIIYGYLNSTAQSYAEKYNRKFKLLDDVPNNTQKVISRNFRSYKTCAG